MANTYTDPQPSDTELDIRDRRFIDAIDVVRFAEAGGVLSGRTRCESWHLDPGGRYVCGTRGTTLDSLSEWSGDPERLVNAYLDGREAGTCTPRWIVVDQRFRGARPSVAPTEADAENFLRLRRQLEVVGIRLLDAVIFDGAGRWWSMSQLLTGSTRWEQHPFPLRAEDVAA